MDANTIAALIGAGVAVAVAIGGVLVFVIKVSITVGKILAGVAGQGATLERHEEILTNGLRTGVRENSDRIGRVEDQLDLIHGRLDQLGCKHPTAGPRCQPTAPHHHNRKGNHR